MSEAKAANITLKVDDQETVVEVREISDFPGQNEEVVQEAAELGKIRQHHQTLQRQKGSGE